MIFLFYYKPKLFSTYPLKLIYQDNWNSKLIYFNYVFLYGLIIDQTLDQIS